MGAVCLVKILEPFEPLDSLDSLTLPRGGRCFRYVRHDSLTDPREVSPQARQDLHGDSFALSDQSEHEMTVTDEVLAVLEGFAQR